MRKYVRPFLFAVARLGLFCAVVTWIAAQSSACMLNVPMGLREILIEAGPRGYMCVLWDPVPLQAAMIIEPLSVGTRSVDGDEGDTHSPGFSGEEHDERFVTHIVNVPGVVLGRYQTAASFVTLRHWFVVAVCVVFYGVLKWVYRNRAGGSGTSLTMHQDQ